MTELAKLNSAVSTVFAPTERQADLMEWVETAKAVQQIAVGLVRTSFVPAGFKNKPEEATAAILAGHEVGLDPIASLRAFDVIQGSAAPRAMTLRAILQARGHDVWVEEESPTRVVAYGQRAGSGKVHQSVWDLDRAKRMDLMGKDNWKKQPQAMLVARATAEVCRKTASDAIMGMPYSAEEMSDQTPPVKAVATRVRPRTIREAVQPAEEEPERIVEDVADPEKDRRRLFAILSELGVTDRDERLAVYSAIVEFAVDSTKGLTNHEVQRISDILAQLSGLPDEQRVEEVGGLIIEGKKIRAGES